MRAQQTGAFEGLSVLPFLNQLGISAEQHVRHLPAIEFRRSGIYRRGKQIVLERIGQG